MNILAICAIFLATSTIISAQILVTIDELKVIPSSRHDMTDACAGASSSAKGPYPDLDDCMQYYWCVDDGVAEPTYPLRCDDKYKCFDGSSGAPATSACSVDPVTCADICVNTEDQCLYSCVGNPGIQIAVHDDCSKRKLCLLNEDEIDLDPCSGDTPFFNGHTCVDEKAQCCNCRKRTCDGLVAGNFIEDVNDCHSFFQCMGDPPVPSGHSTCPEGEGFDYEAGQCTTDSNDCKTICNIVF